MPRQKGYVMARHPDLAACHVGDNEPVCCQSDDQFTVFNHAVKNGMRIVLSAARAAPVVLITVPELGIHGRSPFDYDLHKVAESLRSDDSDFIRLHSCGTFHRISERCP